MLEVVKERLKPQLSTAVEGMNPGVGKLNYKNVDVFPAQRVFMNRKRILFLF